MQSTMLILSRAVIGVAGAGILLLAIGNLSSGARFTDPVFPGGLIAGSSMVGAAAWCSASGGWRAAVVWLGVVGVLLATTILGIISFATTDASVYPFFILPAAIFLAAIGVVARERVRAGAFGGAAAG